MSARARRSPPPPRAWGAGLCDCLQDPSLSCYAVICSCNATGQLYERTSKRGSSCLLVAALLWFLWIAMQSLSTTSNTLLQNVWTFECEWWGGGCEWTVHDGRLTTASVLASLAGLLGLAGAVASTCFLCTSRRSLRQRDQIPSDACGDTCGDCCTAYWCGCCSIVQMLRHERVTGSNYMPCSSAGVAVPV